MSPSIVKRFFEGKPFEDWKKTRQAELKTQSVIVEPLNTVINACGVIAKTVARRP